MAETIQSAPGTPPEPEHGQSGTVAKEQYKGPGSLVTGLGYVSSVHLATTAAAIGIGAILGFAFHKNVNGVVKVLQEKGIAWGRTEGLLAKPTGRTLTWLFGYPDGVYTRIATDAKIMDHIPETMMGNRGKTVRVKKNIIEILKGKDAGFLRNFSQGIVDLFQDIGEWLGLARPNGIEHTLTSELTRSDATVISGGILGGLTWLGAWIWGFAHGGSKSNQGKEQFDRAQSELADLRNKYSSTQTELETLRSDKKTAAPGVAETPLPPQMPVTMPAEIPEERIKKRDDQKPQGLVGSISRDSVLDTVAASIITT